MTKKDLLLQLQKFPEDTPVRLKINGTTFDLVTVEWSVDAAAQVVDNALDTWQAAVAARIRLDLVAKVPSAGIGTVAVQKAKEPV